MRSLSSRSRAGVAAAGAWARHVRLLAPVKALSRVLGRRPALGVVGAACAWQLLDREVFVVALEHLPLHACEEHRPGRPRGLLGGRELAATLGEIVVIDQKSCFLARGRAPYSSSRR